MQYTIRDIPDYLDAALRHTARSQGKSLNEVAILALQRGAGLSEGLRRQRDLRDLAGSWHEDPAFDRAIEEQDTIDESMWPPHPGLGKRAAASSSLSKKRARTGTRS